MCNDNDGAHNTEAHTTDESTTETTHSGIETLGELAEELSDRADEAQEKSNSSKYLSDSLGERAKRDAYDEAAFLVRQFQDDLETDIEELRERGQDLYAQINDMASTAEMLEQAKQAETIGFSASTGNTGVLFCRECGLDTNRTDLKPRTEDDFLNFSSVRCTICKEQFYPVPATGRELAAEALGDIHAKLTNFRSIRVSQDPDGNIQDIEVGVSVHQEGHISNVTVGYVVDGDRGLAQPTDIDAEYADELDLTTLTAVPVANDAVETHVDDITQTVALTDFAHALYERAENDDTPGLRELGQQHGAVADDQEDVQTDGGRGTCSACGATLPEEIDEGTGVYCPNCGHGQHVGGDE